MVAMDVQQCPTGLVRHNDGVVAAERVSGVGVIDKMGSPAKKKDRMGSPVG